MRHERCKQCGRYDFVDSHICPPRFETLYENYDPEYIHTVYARDHEEASEKWAEWYDGEDNPEIAPGMGDVALEVKVRRFDEIAWTLVKVTGEYIPRYRGEILKRGKE